MTMLSRRAVLGAAMAAPAVLTRPGFAQERSIQFGNFASLQGQIIRREVIPAFEKEHNCRVYPTDGATLTHLAALRATRSNPKFDVMLMDDTGVGIAKGEGLIDALSPARIPNLSKVFKRLVLSDGYGAGFAISAGGLYVNPAVTPPLKSYAELWEPRFKRRFLMGTPKYTQSTFLLIATASLLSGKPFSEAQYLIDDKVWAKMAALKENVLTIYDATSQVMMVPQGQAAVGGIEYSKNVYPLKARGVPVDMVFPQEGGFAGVNCITLAKNAPQRELAEAFIDRILSPEVQKLLAEGTLTGPTVEGLSFNPNVAQYLAYPEKKIEEMNLFMPDWNYINPRRPGWLEKYNQVFGS